MKLLPCSSPKYDYILVLWNECGFGVAFIIFSSRYSKEGRLCNWKRTTTWHKAMKAFLKHFLKVAQLRPGSTAGKRVPFYKSAFMRLWIEKYMPFSAGQATSFSMICKALEEQTQPSSSGLRKLVLIQLFQILFCFHSQGKSYDRTGLTVTWLLHRLRSWKILPIKDSIWGRESAILASSTCVREGRIPP